ncbi:hypothetical protein CC78DRAFT_284712 [Lojkania enalia]|uniref:Uncharacterized protein n=1 Tax=Lojkania enalia TaxID=147567 RepID=A0A9P4MZ68_9PLEO|nr:hypothetical protein CC78DRAFT_284712 [Didymosphaeria enalia]
MLRMAHDQNFCGNRLRLSTFLRVVKENTLRPPSRFQRHAQYVAQIHAGEDQISSGSCDLGRYIVPSTGAPVEASCKHANLEGASPRRPPSDCNCSELLQPASGCASPGSSGDTWVAQISKLTSSQVDLVLHIDDKNRKDFRHEFASHQQVQTSERSGNDIVYKVKPRGVDIPAHNSPSTRRRRLPVNELALKRTTTVDGLPDRTV